MPQAFLSFLASVRSRRLGSEAVNVGFDHLDDDILLAARHGEPARMPAQLADRPFEGRLGVRPTEQIIGADAQGVCQCCQLFGAQSDGFAFPIGNHALRDAEFFHPDRSESNRPSLWRQPFADRAAFV